MIDGHRRRKTPLGTGMADLIECAWHPLRGTPTGSRDNLLIFRENLATPCQRQSGRGSSTPAGCTGSSTRPTGNISKRIRLDPVDLALATATTSGCGFP